MTELYAHATISRARSVLDFPFGSLYCDTIAASLRLLGCSLARLGLRCETVASPSSLPKCHIRSRTLRPFTDPAPSGSGSIEGGKVPNGTVPDCLVDPRD